ncbi:MAG: sensor histidine kinase [Pseudomonadota bacterium]
MWRLGKIRDQPERPRNEEASGVLRGSGKPQVGGFRVALLLFLFGAGLLVPCLAFTAFMLERSWERQEQETEHRLQQVAADLAFDIDRELQLLIATLATLAASPDTVVGDWASLHAKASQSLKPLGIELLVRDRNGQQLMNTRRSWGSPLPREDLPEIDAAVRDSLQPYVSDVIVGAVAGGPVVALTVPILRNGAFDGFLHMSIDPTLFWEKMRGQKLPPEWNTGLSDRKGIIISRLLRHEDFVGKPLANELRVDGPAVYATTNLEGVKTLRAVRRSTVSGWLVSANLPESVAHAASIESTRWIAVGGALMLLLALVVALFLGRLVAKPIAAIADHARLVEHEKVPPPLVSPVREANEVAAVLRRVAERLQQGTRTLRGTLERLDVALRAADIVVYAQDRERRLTWISRAGATDLIGSRGEETLPSEMAVDARMLEERALATGEAQQGEVRHGRGESTRYFRLHVEPVRDSAGAVSGLLGVSMEITALKQSEGRNAFLVRELTHRSKNLLMVVQAIATETARGASGAEDFGRRFAWRLQALARLQDLTVSGVTGEVSLEALARSQLEPFIEPSGGRLRMDGPAVTLTSEAANNLGMALHELATNATKYGALSNETGYIELKWSIGGAAGDPRFRMAWRECGGPSVVPPRRRGFGGKLLGGLTGSALGAVTTLDYPQTGVVWSIDAPLGRILAAEVPVPPFEVSGAAALERDVQTS